MQKRELGKQGGGSGGSATPAAKRGRPFGSGGSNSAASLSAPDSVAPSTLLGPSLQVHSAFAGQSMKTLAYNLSNFSINCYTQYFELLVYGMFLEYLCRFVTILSTLAWLLLALLEAIPK